ncbi:hypothetical protein GCM10010129_58570 [Streptomyces fumigatiscleroticus]|nr:hypothetical protein GCM10010129_58570 [Streptomyces fumigatiscleroticus]
MRWVRLNQAEARDPTHLRDWIVLVDGARHQLDLIQDQAALRGITVHIVIDFVHVLEYLWQAAWSLHAPGDPAAEDWVAVHALTVLSGNARQTARTIARQIEKARLTRANRHGADVCIRYLTSKGPFLRYDRALAAGRPIATGVIEGACRHLITDRLDITGTRRGLNPHRRAAAVTPALPPSSSSWTRSSRTLRTYVIGDTPMCSLKPSWRRRALTPATSAESATV